MLGFLARVGAAVDTDLGLPGCIGVELGGGGCARGGNRRVGGSSAGLHLELVVVVVVVVVVRTEIAGYGVQGLVGYVSGEWVGGSVDVGSKMQP